MYVPCVRCVSTSQPDSVTSSVCSNCTGERQYKCGIEIGLVLHIHMRRTCALRLPSMVVLVQSSGHNTSFHVPCASETSECVTIENK